VDYYRNQDKWCSVPRSVKFEVSMMRPWRVSALSNGWCYTVTAPCADRMMDEDYGRV